MTTPPFDPTAWPPEPSDDGLSAKPTPERAGPEQSEYADAELSALDFSSPDLLTADDVRPDDDPLARLLRESLQREASTFRLEGDGLQRIRTRVARRRRWLAIRPVLAVAGAAAVIALIVVVPTIAGGRDGGSNLAGGQVATASGDMHSAAIVWPYQDSKQAADNAASDIDSATLPDLTDPKVTAQSFIDTMFPGAGLRAGAVVQKQSGVSVSISSPEGGEIASIDLRPVKSDDRTVYVVSGVNTKPTGHQLTVAPVGTPSAGVLPLNGTVRNAASGGTGVVNLQLFAPGHATPAGTGSVSYPTDGGQHNWSYRLPVDDYFEGNGFVLAWTQDAAGVPTAIVAAPTGAPSTTAVTEVPTSVEPPPSSAPASSAVPPSSPAAPVPSDPTVQSSAPSSTETPSSTSSAPSSSTGTGTDPGSDTGSTPDDDTDPGGSTPYSGG